MSVLLLLGVSAVKCVLCSFVAVSRQLLIYSSAYIPTLICDHELWIEVAEVASSKGCLGLGHGGGCSLIGRLLGCSSLHANVSKVANSKLLSFIIV